MKRQSAQQAGGRYILAALVAAELFMSFSFLGYIHIPDDILRWDFIPFILLAGALGAGSYLFVQSEKVRVFFVQIREVDRLHARMTARRPLARAAAVILVGLAALSVAIYFTDRIETVLGQYRFVLTDESSYDLMHLQIQFLMGILSLGALVLLGIILYQKHTDFLYYEARLDGLTGLLGRQQFFHVGAAALAANQARLAGPEPPGCFMILDVDHFKQINDTRGHPAGDRLLVEVARGLRQAFGEGNFYGRLGGDEFVALILEPLTQQEIETALCGLRARLRRLGFGLPEVTCSIGVIPLQAGMPIERMYRDADRLLYEAKKEGRDRFVFGYGYRDHAEQET